MKNMRKFIITTIIAILSLILLNNSSYAYNYSEVLENAELSEKFKNYLTLSESEKKKVIMPQVYNIPAKNTSTQNPIALTYRVGSTLSSSYDLRDVIPENVVIRDQKNQNLCWSFSMLGALESHLGLTDHLNNKAKTTYDFSERHMRYATFRNLLNGPNEYGYNFSQINTGATIFTAQNYLINGTGAVSESDMPYQDNDDNVAKSEVFNKTIKTQVFDTSFLSDDEEDHTQLKNTMKEYIMKYGGLVAQIHGADLMSEYYNNTTGSIYCDNADNAPIDHSICIIGWDDNYSVDNFTITPSNPGAWIIKNSWGTETKEDADELKQQIYDHYTEELNNAGINSPSDITNESVIEFLKRVTGYDYTYKNGEFCLDVADNGYMYISYEDVNIYSLIYGIEKANYNVDYDNLYQYDELGFSTAMLALQVNEPTYFANIFTKKATEEWLTQVSLFCVQDGNYSVLVNPNGSSLNADDLQEVPLVAGSSENLGFGFHSLELKTPIKINGPDFAVVVKADVNDSYTLIPLEGINDSMPSEFNTLKIESEKCFVATESYLRDTSISNEDRWMDLSTVSAQNQTLPSGDLTIKAYTKTTKPDMPDTPENTGSPINSNLDNSKATVKKVMITSTSSNDMDSEIYVEIDNVQRNSKNDSFEYFYCVSENPDETPVLFVRADDVNFKNNTLSFRVVTNKLANIDDLKSSDEVYLYLQETAKLGQDSSTKVYGGFDLKANSDTEFYYNGKKINSSGVDHGTGVKDPDPTTAKGSLPQTGQKSIIIAISAIVILGIIVFVRYKIIKIK